jgi:CheY-like chemotaxis protein
VVTKRLVELMGGAIGVDSTVGAGSVFWIELISAAAPQFVDEGGEAADSRQHLPYGARLRTLLCVEDNPANLKLVEELIARCPDLRLLTAVNGTLGIDLARASQPEMILMDVNLPDISGIEALKILREDPLTAHIPIVALSANAMPRDIVKGLEAGFFRYLTKPIKVNEFMDTLRMALELADQRTAEAGRVFPLPDARVIVPISRTTGLRILVAEDHPVNQEVSEADPPAAGTSRRGRCRWPRGIAALEQSGRETFDLVLMDVQMPVMGGLEATAAIRDAEPRLGVAPADRRAHGACHAGRPPNGTSRPAWTGTSRSRLTASSWPASSPNWCRPLQSRGPFRQRRSRLRQLRRPGRVRRAVHPREAG